MGHGRFLVLTELLFMPDFLNRSDLGHSCQLNLYRQWIFVQCAEAIPEARNMGTSDKKGLISAWIATEPETDSAKAREFVKKTYERTGGQPTPGLERVYGEYLKHEKSKSKTQSRKD
jgi:hypothetical protein